MDKPYSNLLLRKFPSIELYLHIVSKPVQKNQLKGGI
jgi:hypothetical protein